MRRLTAISLTAVLSACPGPDNDTVDPDTDGPLVCEIEDGEQPDSASRLGCPEDFDALAAAPLDASIPGARSAKTLVDRSDSKRCTS